MQAGLSNPASLAEGRADAPTGRVLGVVLLSLLTPGLGHIRLGAWQIGLILVGFVQLAILGVLAIPHLLAPTPKAVLLLAGLGVLFLGFAALTAVHAAIVARRRAAEADLVSGSRVSAVPLPLDIRVQNQTGDTDHSTSKAPRAAWLAAMCLIVLGISGAVQLPARWAIATIDTAVMAPTLASGDRVLIDLHRVGLAPRRGDIVLLDSHVPEQPFLLRRVVGLGGDRIVLRRMSLMLNGNRTDLLPTGAQTVVDGTPRPIYRAALPATDPFLVIPDATSQVTDEPRLIIVAPGSALVMRDDRATPIAVAGAVSLITAYSDVKGTATTLLWSGSGGFLKRL